MTVTEIQKELKKYDRDILKEQKRIEESKFFIKTLRNTRRFWAKELKRVEKKDGAK